MSNATLQLGGGNFAVKDGKLLGYATDPKTSVFVSREFDFSRGSNLAATRVDANGLIEKGRENLVLQSNQFDTTWLTNNASVTSGQSGYDGTNNAWLLTATNTFNRVQQSISVSGVKRFSVYAKANTNDYLLLGSFEGSHWYATYNLVTGAVDSNNINVISPSIEDVGGGWYRCSGTWISTTTEIRIGTQNASSQSAWATTTSGSIFIQDAQLEAGLVATDYIETGATTAQAGILENMPRIDYTNSSSPALLLEPQRTNLVTQSELFDGFFSTQAAAQIENDTISPEGFQNAIKMYPTATGTYKGYIKIFGSTLNNTTYTLSVFAKAAEFEHMYFYEIGAVGGTNGVWFNLATGNVGTIQSAWSNAKMTDMGDGWYRCEASVTYGGSADYWYIFASDADATSTATASGTNGLYLYGAQLEEGSYATSYIPTYGSAVTRNSESCEITSGLNFIGQEQGTMYWDIDFIDNGGYPAIFLYDGTANNRLLIQRRGNNNVMQTQARSSGSLEADYLTSSAISNGNHKMAVAYATNDFQSYLDGASAGSDSSGTTYTNQLTQVSLKPNEASIRINQVLLFKTRLSNADLATLTTL